MTARLERIRRLERIGLATWPALEEAVHDGWVLRAAGGITLRSNSVSPLESLRRKLGDAIADAESWYRSRGLPPAFRLTAAAPPNLEPRLARRGYVPDPAVDVMVRPIGTAAGGAGVRLDAAPSNAWFAALMAVRFPGGTSADVVRRMLARASGPITYASIASSGRISAMGMGAVRDEHIAVYLMHTVPSERRRGLGTSILDGLLAWGRSEGAGAAFLQVHTENPGGLAFYRRAGFRTVYRHWYRIGR